MPRSHRDMSGLSFAIANDQHLVFVVVCSWPLLVLAVILSERSESKNLRLFVLRRPTPRHHHQHSLHHQRHRDHYHKSLKMSCPHIAQERLPTDPNQKQRSRPAPSFAASLHVTQSANHCGQTNQRDANRKHNSQPIPRMPKHHLHRSQPAGASECEERNGL